jgi:hypothetical protein
MNQYKEYKDRNGELACILFGAKAIPLDPANTDYQEYLKWVAEGNTPEPADQGE